MGRLTKSLVLFVIVFHGLVFVAEAILWMRPTIHERILNRLAISDSVSLQVQAQVLRAFLVNQGFYNLFLAIAGVMGLVFLARGETSVGDTLVRYMCFSALGAGIVLALSTNAYVGAALQAIPPAIALVLLFRAGPHTR